MQVLIKVKVKERLYNLMGVVHFIQIQRLLLLASFGILVMEPAGLVLVPLMFMLIMDILQSLLQ